MNGSDSIVVADNLNEILSFVFCDKIKEYFKCCLLLYIVSKFKFTLSTSESFQNVSARLGFALLQLVV